MRGFGSGDVRTEARGAWLFERIVTTGSVVLSSVGGSEAGTAAAHRYLSSSCADWQGILQAFAARTAQACAGRPIVAVQDTSEINFTSAAAGRHGLGPAGNGRNPGFFLHPVIAVDAEDEAVLGLVDAQLWTRAARPTAPRHRRPVEHKESQRWITGAAAAATALADTAQSLIVVADQEGDIYSHFARRPAGSDLLVRARHDRPLVEGGSLQDKASWPVATTGTVEVPARPGVPARIAKVRLQAGAVEVVRPSGLGAREPASLRLHGVCVQELAPPAGVTPLCWRLLTTRAVPDAAAAQEMVRLYRLRWRVEIVLPQLTKASALAIRADGNHVADLDLG
ncbi:IS4 family transposase, partial [Methylobacterium sp. EM32]|uniref:IS4 family transposase n=1 Tax=Methylobacterium sp. EM32 TaxID=3163481 RepID=UPI0033B6360B